MIATLGLIACASVALHVEQWTDVPVESVGRPMLAELAAAIEERTGERAELPDLSAPPCARTEPACRTPDRERVVYLRVIGGVRKTLVIAERVDKGPSGASVRATVRLELDASPDAWRTPIWEAVRALFDRTSVTVAASTARGPKVGMPEVLGALGGTLTLAGTSVLIHAAVFGASLGGPQQTRDDFESGLEQLALEERMGAVMLGAGLSILAGTVVWALVSE